MRKVMIVAGILLALGSTAYAAEQRLRFWNTTAETITGVTPGRYDVRLVDKKRRVCVVPNVELVSGRPYAFSLSEKDLTNCTAMPGLTEPAKP